MNPYTTQSNRNVLTVRFENVAIGYEQWILLRSDAHHDSPYCNRELEKKHLDMALERNALILDCGDCLDAMQGKFDPRRSYDDIRSEDAGIDYYDRIVAHAAEFYDPYKDNWILFSKGNHEQAVLKNTNHCPTTALVTKLGGPAVVGGYGGWVRFQFVIHHTKIATILLKYFHGTGGAAPVTRSTIQTNRQQVYLPDADIIWNGHYHHSWVMPIARERVSRGGEVYRDLCWHVRTAGYKDDYRNGECGFEVERGGSPKPLGAVWLRLFVEAENTKSGGKREFTRPQIRAMQEVV